MSSYQTLKTTWVKQEKYTLTVKTPVKEPFGSFSIRAAVRPPYYNNNWVNPWERQETFPETLPETLQGTFPGVN